MIRITATNLSTGKTVFDGQYEAIETAIDVGHKVQTVGDSVEVNPTGKKRLVLRAWTGMQSYEDFVDIINETGA